MGLCSDIYAQKQQQKQKAIPTQQQRVATPVRKAHILNPLADVVTGVQEAIPRIPQMAVDFGKSAVNNVTAFSNPLEGARDTALSLGRGVVQGAVDLAPSVAGLGVDVVNSIAGKPVINMPEERRRPLGYALEQWRDIQNTQNNLAKPSYKGQDVASLGIKPASNFGKIVSGNTPNANKTQFAEMMGQFAVPMGVVKKGADTVKAIQTANKVAKEATRIASKLDDVKKAKYATQINKLAQKNVASKATPETFGHKIMSNTATGAGLGALEGEDLQQRAVNATGGAALGAGLTAAHAGMGKVGKTKLIQDLKKDAIEKFKTATKEFDSASKAVAFIDNAFNTNLSKNSSDLTKTRKKAYNILSKNTNLMRNMDNATAEMLAKAGDLSKKEQKKIFNINTHGERVYNEHTKNNGGEFKNQEPYKETKQPETSESNLSPAKEQTNTNLPKDTKTLENKPLERPQIKQSDKIKQRISELEKELDNNKEFLEEENNYEPKDWNKYEKDSAELAELKKELKEVEYDERIRESIKEMEDSNVQEHYDADWAEIPSEEAVNELQANLKKKHLTNVKSDSGVANEIKQEQPKQETKKDVFEQDEFGNYKKVKPKQEYVKPQEVEQVAPKINEVKPIKPKRQKSIKQQQLEQQYKDDVKNNTVKKHTSINDKVIKLEPGEAEGADYLYKFTKGEENIYDNTINERPTDRTVGMDEAHRNKLKKLTSKYEVIEDPKTNKNIIINKSTGKPITPKQRKALAKYFDEYRESDKEISQEDRIKAEIEESVEDNTYYDKYNDNLSPTNGEGSTGIERFGTEYKSKNPEFVKWYDEYKKLSDKEKKVKLKQKFDEFKTQKELKEFYEEFVRQEESEAQSNRAKKIGDEYSDTANVEETERLSEVADELKIDEKKFEPDSYDVEETKPGRRSPAFQKVIDSVWKEKVNRGSSRKTYFEGSLNRARTSEQIQTIYDGLVKKIKVSEMSSTIKQAMLEDLNTMADKVIENKKVFGVELNKLEDFNITKEAIDALKQANERGNVAEGREIIDNNKLQNKYLNAKGKEVLKEHYMLSADNFHKQIGEMGLKLKEGNNGAKVLAFNIKQGRLWCEEQIRKQYANNPKKMQRELSFLKNDENVKRIVRNKYTLLFEQNKNIIANDVRYAYENPQYTLVEKAVKGDTKRYYREASGDTWDKTSSDVLEGERKSKETIRALEKGVNKETDNTRAALGAIGKKLAELGRVIDIKSAPELFKDVELPDSIKYLFNKYKKQGVTVTTEDGRTGFNYKTGELFVKHDSDVANMVSKVAHEFGHKEIYDAIYEGGKTAVNVAYKVLGEKLSPEETVKALKEAVNENVEANNKFAKTVNSLYEKYGKDFVLDAIKEGEDLRQQGKTIRSLIKDKRDIIKSFEKALPRTKVEKYCDDIERSALNEFRTRQQLGKGTTTSGRGFETNSEENNPTRKGNRSQGKQENLESNSKEGRHKGLDEDAWEGTEYSTTSHKIFDMFNKKKETKSKQTFDKLKKQAESDSKVKTYSDMFKTLSESRESDFNEFGTFSPEQMKNRLYQQSLFGEGIYTLQGSKANSKIDLSRKTVDKIGFMGRKTKQGVNQKGTIQQSLERMLSDEVKRSQAREYVNLLKDNFKEPKEGYLPVNSKLLWNTMYWGKSKEFYRTISKGKESIKEIFDEENSKVYSELFDRIQADKPDIYIPKDLFDLAITGDKELPLDWIKTYGKGKSVKNKLKGQLKLAGAFIDWKTDRFKRKVLTSASFFTNNRFGNQIMLAANSDNPMEYFKSIIDAFKFKEGDVPREILESTLSEMINSEANGRIRKYFGSDANWLDTTARILDGDFIDLKTVEGAGKKALASLSMSVSAINLFFKKLSQATGNINEKFERFERKQAASIVLSKMQKQKVLKTAKSMASVKELADIVNDNPLLRQTFIDKVNSILGDYNNFGKAEKNVLKKIYPFYAWNRTIIRHCIDLCRDNPEKAIMIAYETYRLLNQDDKLEDYQHGSIKTPFRNKRTGTNVVLNKTSMIPYNTIFDMVSGETISNINPIITKPIEAIKGEKFFKPASEITSKNWKRTSRKGVKGYINLKTGEFREGSLPLSSRVGYLAKDMYETVFPNVGSPMTKGLPDAVKHKMKTGEFLFPDKQFDASLGGYYHGDKYGSKTLSAKNRLDLNYQLLNRLGGLGIQPEHRTDIEKKKEQVRKRKAKFKKKAL